MAKGMYVGVKSTLDPAQDSFKIVSGSKQDFVDRKIIVPGGVGGSKYWDTTNMTSSTFYPDEAVDFASSTIWPSSFNFSNKFFLFANDLTHLYVITSVSNKTEIKTEISAFALDPESSVEITASGSVYDIAVISLVARKVKKMYVGIPESAYTAASIRLKNPQYVEKEIVVQYAVPSYYWSALSNGQLAKTDRQRFVGIDLASNITMLNGKYVLFDVDPYHIYYVQSTIDAPSPQAGDITEDPETTIAITGTIYDIEAVARKVKKGYVGVGGVARPFFSEKPIEFYSTMTWAPSYSKCSKIVSFYTGQYVIFLGMNSPGGSTLPFILDNSLVASTSTYYNGSELYHVGGAVMDKYVVFVCGDGYRNSRYTNSDACIAYDMSRVKIAGISYPYAGTSRSGNTLSNKAVIFIGGYSLNTSGTKSYSSTAVKYDDSLTRSMLTSLPRAADGFSSAKTGDYVIFVGGAGSTSGQEVNVYSSTGTKINCPNADFGGATKGMTIGDYALFIHPQGSFSAIMSGYNNSLTKVSDISYPYLNYGANVGKEDFGTTIGVLNDKATTVPIIVDKNLTVIPNEEQILATNNNYPFNDAGIVGQYLVFYRVNLRTNNLAVFKTND